MAEDKLKNYLGCEYESKVTALKQANAAMKARELRVIAREYCPRGCKREPKPAEYCEHIKAREALDAAENQERK